MWSRRRPSSNTLAGNKLDAQLSTYLSAYLSAYLRGASSCCTLLRMTRRDGKGGGLGAGAKPEQNQVGGEQRRRRRLTTGLGRRASVTLSAEAHRLLKMLVSEGVGPSVSAVVETSIREQARRFKRRRLIRAYEEAASDPAFQDDVQAVIRDFSSTLGDGLNSPEV